VIICATSKGEGVNQVVQERAFGQIHSVFDHAISLEIASNLIGIVNQKFGNSPYNICIRQDKTFCFSRFQGMEGHPVSIDNDIMSLPRNFKIDFRQCHDWSPDHEINAIKVATNYQDGVTHFSQLLNKTIQIDGIQSHQDKTIGIHRLIFRASPQEIRCRIRDLIGLGIGLTPSGDDFLAGLMGLLVIARHKGLLNQRTSKVLDILKDCVSQNTDKTTPHSGMLLMGATNGWLPERVLTMIRCILEASDTIETALRQVLSIGHSSGYDCCQGIYSAFRLINLQNKQIV